MVAKILFLCLLCQILRPVSAFRSPCDFDSCSQYSNHVRNLLLNDKQTAKNAAICYVACLENKHLNFTSLIKMSSAALLWPSASKEMAKDPKLLSCTAGCARVAPANAGCTGLCSRASDRSACEVGCKMYADLQADSMNSTHSHIPASPLLPPQADQFSIGDVTPKIHFNLTSTQPSQSNNSILPFANIPPGYLHAFVVRMSYNGMVHYQYMWSSEISIESNINFACKYVNISFAVANRYGLSQYSPVGQVCGGGVIYPRAVSNLRYKFIDDPERRQEKLLKVELEWEHSPDHDYVTEYEVHVSTRTTTEGNCPDYTTPKVFKVPKNATGTLLESQRNGRDFIIPVECIFEVEVISQPENKDDASSSRKSVSFKTDYIGDSNLKIDVREKWDWNKAGFYTLNLNITLPRTTYIPECIDHILIQVHTALIKPGPGEIKIKQVLPSDKISVLANKLQYRHTLKARYPPLDVNDGLEYIFGIRSELKDECYYYRRPSPKEIKFSAPSYAPSPAENVTIESSKLDGNQATVTLSWDPPSVSNGNIWSYAIYMSHDIFPDQDDQQLKYVTGENTRYTFTKVIIPEKPQYIMVRAENFYKTANWSEPVVLTFPVGPETSPGLIYGLVAAAVVVAAVLVILIILAIICCWQKRKDKVVFLKDTENEWYVGGKGNALDTVPVDSLPVDQWEISPDQIIMDKQLGSGNFGEVFLGKLIGAITTPGVGTYIGTRSVAVKLLKNDAGPELKVDFLKEISTMKKISLGRCPHVVNMVGCCTLQEPLALVLEYASYGDLLEYLRTMRRNYVKKNKEYEEMKANPYLSPLANTITPLAISNDYVEEFQTVKSMQEVTCDEEKKDDNPYASLGELEPFDLISFAYQIAMGMEYLASIPIVHRDLACRNILVDENKVLKISDFGLARTDEFYVKNTDGKLPLRWMALESIVERTFSHKSDVWSYGVTLWEICTLGGHPYPTISNKQLLQFLLQGNRLEKPHNCSDDIYNVMKRCWDADSEERPTFAELRATFDIMMSNQQTESYVDLNVDDLLPYYQMKPAEEDVNCPHTPTFPVIGPTKSLPIDSTDTMVPDNTSIDEPTF